MSTKKTKVPYLYILIAILLLTVLILIIPFTGRREEPDAIRQTQEETSGPETQPTARSILLTALDAHGGMKSISSLNSLKMTTTSSLGPDGRESARETAFYSFPGKMKSEASIGDNTYVQSYNEGSAWYVENGVASPGDRRMIEFLRRSLKHFPNFLIQATDSTAITMIKGKSFIDGKPPYIVYVIDGESDETTLWIDLDELHVSRMDYPVFAGEVEEHVRLDLLDYRKTDGILLPYRVRLYMNGLFAQETTILTYEINPGLNDSLFVSPLPPHDN